MTKLQAAERRLAFAKSLLSGASADSVMELLVPDVVEKAASLVQGGEPALRHLLNLLNSHKKTIRKETCWVISNITAGTTNQIQEVIDAGLIPPLVQLLASGLSGRFVQSSFY